MTGLSRVTARRLLHTPAQLGYGRQDRLDNHAAAERVSDMRAKRM